MAKHALARTSDSTRRSLRTLYQGVVAFCTTVPLVLGVIGQALPASTPLYAEYVALSASIIGALAVVTKVLNALEDTGRIPAWLKGPEHFEVVVVEGGAAGLLPEMPAQAYPPEATPLGPLPSTDAAAIAACPTPIYHETHRYCPSCPWIEPG